MLFKYPQCSAAAVLAVLVLGLAAQPSKANGVDPQSFDIDVGPIDPTVVIPEGGLLDFYDNNNVPFDIYIDGIGDFTGGSQPGPSPDFPASSFFDVFVDITMPPGSYTYHDSAFPEVNGTLNVTPIPGALPLFAGGLGALGLLGWRRKRRAQTLA